MKDKQIIKVGIFLETETKISKYLYKYNTYSHKNMSPKKTLVVIPEDLYISH